MAQDFIFSDKYGPLCDVYANPSLYTGSDIESRKCALYLLERKYPSNRWYTTKTNGSEPDIISIGSDRVWRAVEVKTNSHENNDEQNALYAADWFTFANIPQRSDTQDSFVYYNQPGINEDVDSYIERLGVERSIPSEFVGRRFYMLIAESANGVFLDKRCKWRTFMDCEESLLIECPDGFYYLPYRCVDKCFVGYGRAFLYIQQENNATYKAWNRDDKYLYIVALLDIPHKYFHKYDKDDENLMKMIGNIRTFNKNR